MDSSATPEDPKAARPTPGPAAIRPIWDGEKAAPPPVYTPPPNHLHPNGAKI